MEEKFPETIDQAIEFGFREVPDIGANVGRSGAEVMKEFSLDKPDTQVFGTRNCQNLQEGDWCFKGFVGGLPVVIFCDGNGQCRRRFSK